jgi:hypothetical protein
MQTPIKLTEESNVTVALVERVSDRVAKGIPLRIALSVEPLGLPEYEDHLRRNPAMASREDAAKLKFLEHAIDMLLAVEDPSSNIRWLLLHLYPEVFNRQQGRELQNVTVNVATVTGASETPGISALSEEYVKALQEGGRRL